MSQWNTAASTLPSTSWRKGASTTMPRKPSTTEGRAASSSTKGLMTRRAKGGAISARYTAVMTPRGTASSEESTVTATEPTSSGKMPNRPGSSVGYQRSPSKKSSGLTCRNRGRPSVNRKMTIPASASRDEAAMAVRQMRMARSREELNMVFSEGFLAGRARRRKREKSGKRGKGRQAGMIGQAGTALSPCGGPGRGPRKERGGRPPGAAGLNAAGGRSPRPGRPSGPCRRPAGSPPASSRRPWARRR